MIEKIRSVHKILLLVVAGRVIIKWRSVRVGRKTIQIIGVAVNIILAKKTSRILNLS